MTGQPQDPSDRPPSFGPNRHRMEIELMEKRFRERSDRSGGGPVATEEIDIRIADEARQFFDDSARTLEVVVPQLQEGDQGREMVETTGEIRKKIDQFFTDSAPEVPSSDATPARRGVNPSAPAPAPSATGAAAAAQMDLKTALEKLRRHGVAKATGQVARPATPPSRPSSVLDSSAALEAPARTLATPRSAASEAPPANPDILPAMDTTGSVPQPPSSRPREAVELMKHLSSLPPLDTDEVRLLDAPAPLLRGARAADGEKTATETRERDETDGEPRREPAPERLRDPSPDVAAVGEFDSIFSAVEGIVLDTLKSSMNETMSAARKSEPELADVAVPTAEPMAELPETPDTATQDLAQDISEKLAEGELRQAPQDETRDVPLDDTRDDSVSLSQRDLSETFTQEAVSDFVKQDEDPGVFGENAAPKLPAPREDDEDEDVDAGTPAAGPYDWGVKPAARPRGAWLLDTPDESAEAPAPARPKPEAEPKTPTSVAAEAPSTGGPRAFLIRKASDEVRKFQSVVDALEKADVIGRDAADPKPDAPAAGDDDDEVSLDSFHDDRPSPEEVDQELSPMRLVEELRKLRRLTQALVDKGVIAASEVEKSDSE